MKKVWGMLVLFLALAGPIYSGPTLPYDLNPVKPEIPEAGHYWSKFHQEVWFHLGVSYLFKEKYLESYNAFYLAATYDPLAPEVYQNLAFVAFKMGDFREAAAALSVSIELEPNNAEAHHLLGVIYTIYAMYDNAIEELEKAIAISPEDPLIHYDLGFAREFGGQYGLAQESYRAALEINPQFAEAQHRLDVVAEKVSRDQESLGREEVFRRGK